MVREGSSSLRLDQAYAASFQFREIEFLAVGMLIKKLADVKDKFVWALYLQESEEEEGPTSQ